MLLLFIICSDNVDCDTCIYNVFYCLYIECEINISIYPTAPNPWLCYRWPLPHPLQPWPWSQILRCTPECTRRQDLGMSSQVVHLTIAISRLISTNNCLFSAAFTCLTLTSVLTLIEILDFLPDSY